MSFDQTAAVFNSSFGSFLERVRGSDRLLVRASGTALSSSLGLFSWAARAVPTEYVQRLDTSIASTLTTTNNLVRLAATTDLLDVIDHVLDSTVPEEDAVVARDAPDQPLHEAVAEERETPLPPATLASLAAAPVAVLSSRLPVTATKTRQAWGRLAQRMSVRVSATVSASKESLEASKQTGLAALDAPLQRAITMCLRARHVAVPYLVASDRYLVNLLSQHLSDDSKRLLLDDDKARTKRPKQPRD